MGVYELTGRTALVTGGARGLGAGMAEALARAGAAVMIGDLRDEEGRDPPTDLKSPVQPPPSSTSTSPTTPAGRRRSTRRSANSAAWTS